MNFVTQPARNQPQKHARNLQHSIQPVCLQCTVQLFVYVSVLCTNLPQILHLLFCLTIYKHIYYLWYSSWLCLQGQLGYRKTMFSSITLTIILCILSKLVHTVCQRKILEGKLGLSSIPLLGFSPSWSCLQRHYLYYCFGVARRRNAYPALHIDIYGQIDIYFSPYIQRHTRTARAIEYSIRMHVCILHIHTLCAYIYAQV